MTTSRKPSQVEMLIVPSVVPTQVKVVAQAFKSKIATALVNKLSEISRLKYISFDKIKLAAADFADHEIPAVQIIDVSETIQHEQARAKKFWQMAIEIIMKPTENEYVNQQDLWNLQYEIERKIWADPQLGVGPGMIQMVYLGNATDLHLLEPYYICRMDVEAQYYEHLVRDC